MKTSRKQRLQNKLYVQTHKKEISINKKKYYVTNKKEILVKRILDYKSDPEKFIKRKRKERLTEKCKATVNKYRLWKFYRLLPEERIKIEDFQKNDPVYNLVLGQRNGTDHDHKTGLIRGILDWRLNRALGIIERISPEKTKEILHALLSYYENSPAKLALEKEVYGMIGQAKVKKRMIYGPPKELQNEKPT